MSRRFRRAGYQAIDRICDYYISLRDMPVSSQVEPGYLKEALPGVHFPFWLWLFLSDPVLASPPTVGEDFQLIADDYQQYILPGKLAEYESRNIVHLIRTDRPGPLAASLVLCLLPYRRYVRSHPWRTLRL